MHSPLHRIIVPNYGPFVFGRRRSNLREDGFTPSAPPFVAPSSPILRVGRTFDHNAIRDAATHLVPIYGAEEDALGNQRFGDCTCAGMLHAAALLQAIFSYKVWRRPTQADALALYARVTNPPFDLRTGANDNGADLVTVMDVVAAGGAYSDGSFKIKDPLAVDATNQAEVKAAIDAHRVLYMGAALPSAWLPANGKPVAKVWDVAGPGNPDDGHCTLTYDYNDQGVQINTWGEFVTITWAALAAYYSNEAGGELYTFSIA